MRCCLNMMLQTHTGGWTLLFLAAFIPGFHLQRNDSSTQTEVQIYRPDLQPSEAVPPTETYMLKNVLGTPCIKATLGAVYMVTEQKTWYWSLDSSRVRISGYCGNEDALLSLRLPENVAELQFKFRKEQNVFYVTKMSADLAPHPVCQGCANKTYSGLLDHQHLFMTTNGQSFSCKSESLLLMSPQLRIKLVPLRIQAFIIPQGQYRKEMECWADFNKRVLPIILGATVVGLLLTAVLTFLMVRDRRRGRYDRI